MASVAILRFQTDGHKQFAPAVAPDPEKQEELTDSHGVAHQAAGVKQHPILNTNQLRGVNTDGKRPTSPADMSQENLEEAIGKLQLTPGAKLEKQLGREAAPTKTFNPQPAPR